MVHSCHFFSISSEERKILCTAAAAIITPSTFATFFPAKKGKKKMEGGGSKLFSSESNFHSRQRRRRRRTTSSFPFFCLLSFPLARETKGLTLGLRTPAAYAIRIEGTRNAFDFPFPLYCLFFSFVAFGWPWHQDIRSPSGREYVCVCLPHKQKEICTGQDPDLRFALSLPLFPVQWRITVAKKRGIFAPFSRLFFFSQDAAPLADAPLVVVVVVLAVALAASPFPLRPSLFPLLGLLPQGVAAGGGGVGRLRVTISRDETSKKSCAKVEASLHCLDRTWYCIVSREFEM